MSSKTPILDQINKEKKIHECCQNDNCKAYVRVGRRARMDFYNESFRKARPRNGYGNPIVDYVESYGFRCHLCHQCVYYGDALLRYTKERTSA